jgi:hypothetical protein
MAAPVAPVQVGIFTNDLCIGFRIIMHEVLDNQVYRVFEAAKEIHRTRPQDSFRAMYERGMKSVNAWENQMKERFRAQVIAQYRQLTDLYHHIYLMYVQEMYDQSMDDVTVRVNIPAMSTMLYMFLRLACNHQVILSGEYVTTMSFSGRVLFVETILRRLLYELLVQQNNIKSISTAAGRSRSRPDTKNTISVHSEEDMVSADMLMGTQRQSAPRLSPVNEEDRFWLAPNESESVQSSNSMLSQLSGGALLGPAYNTSPRNSPLANSGLLSDLIPARRTSPQQSNEPSVQSAQTLQSVQSAQTLAQGNSVENLVVPPLDAALATFVSPNISVVLPPPEDTVLTTPVAAAPAITAIIPDNIPRITSLPNNPIISGSVVAASEKSEPLFELKSQFTPFKPGGIAYPDAKVPTGNRRDIDVDSLQLQPSDQDFAEEARRLLQADQGENTVTPFDSVTNIANGDRRPPLFFDPVRAPP